MPDRPLSGFPVSSAFPASLWGLACVLITTVALLAALALAITRLTVRKARPEDLPELLLALGHVFVSLASFLPWGGKDAAGPSEPARPAPESTDATAPTIEVIATRTALVARPSVPAGEEERR
ncbi:hypothetical protein [Streptomyces chrestomyceticus]|uniref:hypothetical protein n=1 Tax=Streptomyces chrestomyceticus TaxID=68185 RepID=UPI0034005F64